MLIIKNCQRNIAMLLVVYFVFNQSIMGGVTNRNQNET